MKKFILPIMALLCFGLNAQVKKEIFESFKLQERRDVSYYFPEDYTDDKKYPLIVAVSYTHLTLPTILRV